MREIASLTKIMTALTTIYLEEQEKVSFTEVVQISKQAAKMSGTSADLRENDEITLNDLLYALMLPSGNDAAWALAEHCGKKLKNGVAGFISELNLNCKKLGLTSTFFKNPHGMATSKNLSTARDVCKMAQIAMQNLKFAEIVGTRSFSCCILNEGKLRIKTWENTNKMLELGFVGVKTGVTPTAGPCLCTAYGNFVIVLLNSRSMEDRWKETQALLNLVQIL
jgi:D-alanyl-D-alanine carboxypeptidase